MNELQSFATPVGERRLEALSADVRAQRRFIVELARSLHSAGTPVHRLEVAVEEVSAALGMKVSVFATPTAIFTSFRSDDFDDTRFDRQDAGETDLRRLAALDHLAQQVIHGELDAASAHERMRDVLSRPSAQRAWQRVLAYAVASAGFAVFFGGTVHDVVLTGLLGLLTGLLEAWMMPRRAKRLFEPLGATIIAALATLGSLFLPVNSSVVIVGGIIVLVPGLSLTQAMTELAHGSLVSGSARMVRALFSFIMLGFGVSAGRELVGVLTESSTAVPELAPPDLLVQIVAMVFSAIAFGTIFRAARRDLLPIVLLSLATLLTLHFSRPALGPVFTALVGAFVVGSFSNAWARRVRRPALVLRVPVMLVLVPGAFGLRSVLQLVEADVIAGVEGAFTVLLLAVALTAGMLLANALVLPRQRL